VVPQPLTPAPLAVAELPAVGAAHDVASAEIPANPAAVGHPAIRAFGHGTVATHADVKGARSAVLRAEGWTAPVATFAGAHGQRHRNDVRCGSPLRDPG
jgi:hypothetical protein